MPKLCSSAAQQPFIVALLGALICGGGISTEAAADETSPNAAAPEEAKGWRQKLARLDANGDGRLSADEFLKNARGKPWEDKAANLFKNNDGDNDGLLSPDEFHVVETWRANRSYRQSVPWKQRMFLVQDTNLNGKVSFFEFYSAKTKGETSKSHYRNWFDAVDRNDDGYLNKSEHGERGTQGVASIKLAREDVNADGRLSHDEFMAPVRGKPWEDKAAENFFKLDRNQDKALSRREIELLVQRKKQRVGVERKPSVEREFSGADLNGNGKLSRDELSQIERTDRHSDSGLDALSAILDRDADGRLSEPEYAAIGNEENPRIAFALLDVDGDGAIAPEEYATPNAGRAWAASRRAEFARHDLDHDGKLTLQEVTAAELEPRAQGRVDTSRIAASPWKLAITIFLLALLGAWLCRLIYAAALRFQKPPELSSAAR